MGKFGMFVFTVSIVGLRNFFSCVKIFNAINCLKSGLILQCINAFYSPIEHTDHSSPVHAKIACGPSIQSSVIMSYCDLMFRSEIIQV